MAFRRYQQEVESQVWGWEQLKRFMPRMYQRELDLTELGPRVVKHLTGIETTIWPFNQQ
jgi:hypothetical protein